MSIVTLKKKARGNKTAISKNGFSLYGGLRVKGWVGQNSLMRDVRYSSSNDPTIIKKTTASTGEYTKHKRECCKDIFKDNTDVLPQDMYIRSIGIFKQTNNTTKLCSGNGKCYKPAVNLINGNMNGAYESYDIYNRQRCTTYRMSNII